MNRAGKYSAARTAAKAAVGVVALLAAGASSASANGVRDLELSMTDGEAVIRLSSSDPLAEPRVRFGRGEVKVWFPEVQEDTRLEVPGDGGAIGRVRLRPGANETALLDIELGDKRRLSAGQLRVERHEAGAVLRIPRAALADVKEHEVAPEPTPVPAQPEKQKLGLAALAQTDHSAATNADPADKPAARGPGLPPALSTANKAGDASGSAFGIMAGITAFLALVYGFIRLWNARRPQLPALPSIEVIGTRRIGHRHQLVLVRALGEDHLLSMNGDRTERIASTPSPGTQADSIRLLPPPRKAPASLASVLDERLAAIGDDAETPPNRETPFGAELLTFMQRRADPSLRPRQRTRADESGRHNSPAVAGLLRLREREAS